MVAAAKNVAAALLPGTRVTVLSRPGTVRYTTADGAIGVSLAGEGNRIDEWHPSQVERCAPLEPHAFLNLGDNLADLARVATISKRESQLDPINAFRFRQLRLLARRITDSGRDWDKLMFNRRHLLPALAEAVSQW